MTRQLDALLSPQDKRDWTSEKLTYKANYSPIVDYRTKLLPIRDQGTQGSCVGMATSNIKEYEEEIDIGLKEYFSPQFIYNLRCNAPDSGMYIRDAMKILQQKGCCREVLYPYSSREIISEKVYKDAENFKIENYAQVTTIEGLKEALINNGPCVCVVPVFNYSNKIWIQNVGDLFKGYHCMSIVGYNDEKQYFIIRNSWSTNYGDKGYCYLPYSEFKSIIEVWTLIDLKSNKIKRDFYYYYLYIKNWYNNLPDAYQKFVIWSVMSALIVIVVSIKKIIFGE